MLNPISIGKFRVRSNGKQVLLDDTHLADARDEQSAEVIVDALNNIGLSGYEISKETNQRLLKFFE